MRSPWGHKDLDTTERSTEVTDSKDSSMGLFKVPNKAFLLLAEVGGWLGVLHLPPEPALPLPNSQVPFYCRSLGLSDHILVVSS